MTESLARAVTSESGAAVATSEVGDDTKRLSVIVARINLVNFSGPSVQTVTSFSGAWYTNRRINAYTSVFGSKPVHYLVCTFGICIVVGVVVRFTRVSNLEGKPISHRQSFTQFCDDRSILLQRLISTFACCSDTLFSLASSC